MDYVGIFVLIFSRYNPAILALFTGFLHCPFIASITFHSNIFSIHFPQALLSYLVIHSQCIHTSRLPSVASALIQVAKMSFVYTCQIIRCGHSFSAKATSMRKGRPYLCMLNARVISGHRNACRVIRN